MNKFLYIAAGILFAACSKETTIEVTNTLDFDRNGELVTAELATPAEGMLVDETGTEVPYQVEGNNILFQANVPANGTAKYTFNKNEKPSAVIARTDAFFLGDRRKDDFAWENDKAAYRMYGPALSSENPSNGVDLWLKHGDTLTVDAMYLQEEAGKPYHIDYGKGIDSYKVGHAVGCGGVALEAYDTIWVGGPYAKYEVIERGPLQCIFKLDYDSIKVGDQILTETLTITVNAGSQVNKAEVIFNGANIDSIRIAGGIFLHEDMGNLFVCDKCGVLSYAENATTDKGIFAIHEQNGLDATQLDFGRNYVAVIVPGMQEAKQYGITEVALKDYNVGDTFTYYFGGGWSKRDYATDDEWFEATKKTAQAIANPLQVVVK